MPVTKSSEAKDSGFAQVRAALVSFEADVARAEFGKWGAKPGEAPQEFMEVDCVNVKPLKVLEELTMDISEKWNFRITCNDYKGSFWIDHFLASADKNKVLIPEGLVGKRVVFTKGNMPYSFNDRVTGELVEGVKSDMIIEKIIGNATAPVAQATVPAEVATPAPQATPVVAEVPLEQDPMHIACELAVGKTETQFRSALGLHPLFVDSSLLQLARAGAITDMFVKEGKLVIVKEGDNEVYRKPS